jgi:nucleoside-diphosphate-sugar epimerase
MKILITGSGGVIGNVLKQGLQHNITHYDLPDFDVHDYNQLVAQAQGHDAIVHLAWDTATDNWKTDTPNPNNALKTANIYRAAVAAGVPRVIMASSVHADRFEYQQTTGLLKPYDLPTPDSPYGAGKVFMESLGRYYADAKDLGVVCVRFGGVNRADQVPVVPESERQVWLSHRDCVSLVTAYLEAPSIPNNYEIVYGVSDNAGRLHDIQNSVGWQPQDGAK